MTQRTFYYMDWKSLLSRPPNCLATVYGVSRSCLASRGSHANGASYVFGTNKQAVYTSFTIINQVSERETFVDLTGPQAINRVVSNA